MASPETAGLDPTFKDPQEARWHDSVMKCFAYDPTYADIYIPNSEDLHYCTDPDPNQFAANAPVTPKNNDPVYQYMDTHEEIKTLRDLPWAVRYLFSKGYTPDTARTYLGEVALRMLFVASDINGVDFKSNANLYMYAQAFSTMYFSDMLEVARKLATNEIIAPDEPALVVIKGIRVGKVIQKPEKLRGSISNQLLATVDVGTAPDQPSSELHKSRAIKQIVCAGVPVLQAGDQVPIALPGAIIGKRGNGPGGFKIEKVRPRGFYVGRQKRRSGALMLSYAEACGSVGPYRGAFFDNRNTRVHEVLRIPNIPDLPPGYELDDIKLGKYGFPFHMDRNDHVHSRRRQAAVQYFMDTLKAEVDPQRLLHFMQEVWASPNKFFGSWQES